MTVIDELRSASLIQAHYDWATSGTGSAVPSLTDADRLRPLADELDGLLRLPADWDSYGGRPVTVTAARAALRLLVDLNWTGLLPSASPMSDGGVTLEWGGDHDGVELAVAGDGTMSVLVDVDGAAREHGVTGASDPVLLDALQWADKLA